MEGTSKSANQLTVGLQALIANSTVQRCAEDTQWSRFIASNGSNIGNSVCRIVMNERLEISRSVETGIMALFVVRGGELRP